MFLWDKPPPVVAHLGRDEQPVRSKEGRDKMMLPSNPPTSDSDTLICIMTFMISRPLGMVNFTFVSSKM